MLQRLLLLLICLFTFITAKAANKDGEVVAHVGSHKIFLADFTTRYFDYIMDSGIKDNIVTRRAVLNNMINEILLFHYDDNKEIFNNKEYRSELLWSEKQALLSFLKDREVYAKIEASENEIRDAFLKVNEKVAASHLYASTEEEAYNLYELVKAGFSFEHLAQQVFTDPALRDNGGYIGYFTWGDMDPDFEEAAYKLNVGEISAPVKTSSGYSIIKLEDRVKHPLLTEYEFQNKKRHLERILKIRKKGPSEKAFVSKIFDPEKIKINEKVLENIFSELIKSNREFSKGKPSDICVNYNNKTYTRGEIENRVNELPLYHRVKIQSAGNLKSVITGFIIQDLLIDAAKEKNYDQDEEVIEAIGKLKNNIFIKYKRANINDHTFVSNTELLDYYHKNIDYFSNEAELNVQEIYVDNLTLADSLKKIILSGKDFGETAKQFSLETTTNSKNGESGFLPKSKFYSLQDQLWETGIGEIAGPASVGDYYAIFKVIGKKEREPKLFGEVKEIALKAVKLEKHQQVMRNYIENLSSKVKIKVDDKLLGNVELLSSGI